jgi:DNA-binding CsgD family transcriptional regulator
MLTRQLSPREDELLELCIEGLTNEAIAERMGVSIGTVNTYWLRIRLKVGGTAKTDTVARIIQEKSDRALRDSNVARNDLELLLARKEQDLLDAKASLSLLKLALDQLKSTVWETNADLKIQIIANGEYPSKHFGVLWEVGRTVQEIFKSDDPKFAPIKMHLDALAGKEHTERLTGEFDNLSMHVLPLREELDKSHVIGCICIINSIGEQTSSLN